VKDAIRRNFLRTFSAGGIFEAEDGRNWAEIQQVLRGHRARRASFNFTMVSAPLVHIATSRAYQQHLQRRGREGLLSPLA